jgi:nucleotide-binding universal stress UspA family protein
MKRILCPIDLSERSTALLKYAAAVQRWYGGCLTVLHVVPTFDAVEVHPGGWFNPVEFAYPMPRETVIEYMRRTIAAASIGDTHVTYEAEAGDPAAVIIARAQALSAEMIVLGTHASGGIEPFVLGSVADSVLRQAACDVLTLPVDLKCARDQIPMSTIVCGVDFSNESLNALNAAIDIARLADARVVLVHAIEWLAEEQPPDTVEFNVSDLRARLVCDAQKKVDGLMDDNTSIGRSIRTRVLTGRAYREVLRVARDEEADLIVVGHHGRSHAPLPLVGSTAEQIVRGSPCPVLTVRRAHSHADTDS